MKYFISLVRKDEDSAYGLEFPDLPGCFAAADTWDAIPAAATEALDLWFEDQPAVDPSRDQPHTPFKMKVHSKDGLQSGTDDRHYVRLLHFAWLVKASMKAMKSAHQFY